MTYKSPFATKERLLEYLNDFFAEVPDGYDPQEVADAIFESLEDWIKYHTANLSTYELVRSKLRERICSA